MAGLQRYVTIWAGPTAARGNTGQEGTGAATMRCNDALLFALPPLRRVRAASQLGASLRGGRNRRAWTEQPLEGRRGAGELEERVWAVWRWPVSVSESGGGTGGAGKRTPRLGQRRLWYVPRNDGAQFCRRMVRS